MTEQQTDSILIETILSLLSIPGNNTVDLYKLLEQEMNRTQPAADGCGIPIDPLEPEHRLPTSITADPQNLRTVCEMLRFMDEMPGGFLIYCADETEQIVYANRALLRIFQCRTLQEFREYTGNSFRGFVHPEDLEAVENSIREQISSNRHDLDYVEYRIIRKDGEVRWLEDYGHYTEHTSAGGLFYVFISDATEKKNRLLSERAALIQEKEKKERKIKRLIEEYDKERKTLNQEHLRRLEVIEGLSINYDSILYADLDTDTIFPYRLSNRTEYQFEGKYQARGFLWYISDYVKTWVHPEDCETIIKVTSPEYIREKLASTKTFYINYRIIKDQQIQYLQLRIVNVGSREHVSQIVFGYRRVDEEVRREIEQKQLLEDALSNATLAITAKNTFLSNMSHDMRTPLNAIFGYTDLAKKSCTQNEAVRDYLEKIETSSRLLLDQIEKVLEISWAEANDIRILESECNLCDILHDVRTLLLPQAVEKKIDITVDSANLEHCDVFSDQDKLRKILLHLANNAVTYTEEGGKIFLSITELKKLPNDYAVYQFVVKDNGIGISEEFLTHIFEPFEREKNTTFSGVHGIGLGLTITKNIIEAMGGKIAVSSVPEKGSTFTVTLRLRIQSQPLSFFIDTEDIISHLLNQRILLVDDNDINLQIETEILRGLGFLIETATNGSIAVDKVKNSSPGDYALVLMDIQMPVLDGRKAAAAIRRLPNPALANIPIIALSADAFENDIRMSIECGMDAHLTKPIDIPLLLETIAKTMQIRKFWSEEKEE